MQEKWFSVRLLRLNNEMNLYKASACCRAVRREGSREAQQTDTGQGWKWAPTCCENSVGRCCSSRLCTLKICMEKRDPSPPVWTMGPRGIILPKRIRRAAPSAAQWESCSSTKIWYAKGTQSAPARAGRRRKDQTGTFIPYSEIGDSSDGQIWKLLIAKKMDQHRTPYG